MALIVAAGSGERLGAERAKAFVALGGRPMVEWSVEALRAVPAVEAIVVALPPGEQAPSGTRGVAGGRTRYDSVRAALEASDGDPVIVHDAARPLVRPALVERVLAEVEAGRCDGAVAALAVTDTVKAVHRAPAVDRTLDRSTLWAVQTPQVVRREAMRRGIESGDRRLAAVTDDVSVVELGGGTVHVVPGDADNIKVTTPLDLRVAELLLAERAP